MKKLFVALSVLSTALATAQNITSSRWNDLFSFNNVLQIREDDGRIIAATENGIFYASTSGTIERKLTKTNGLHDVKISAFDYNPETKIGLVGYANGAMDVITPEGITYIVDVPLATGYTGSKKINHIAITGNQAVVSVGYGVSIFNLERKEFGDTCFFGSGSSFESAKESVLKDNVIYSITNSGLKKHAITPTFSLYNTWELVKAGSFTHIDIENGLMALSSHQQVFLGDDFTEVYGSFTSIKDVTLTGTHLLVTDEIEEVLNNVKSTKTAIHSFDNAGNAYGTKWFTDEKPNSAWLSNTEILIATAHSGIKKNDTAQEGIKPDGPYHNRAFKINLLNDKIWVASGSKVDNYNEPLRESENENLGFYFYNGAEWIYPSFFKNATVFYNIVDVMGEGKDPNQTLLANYYPTANNRYNNQTGYYKFRYNDSSKDFDFVKHFPNPTRATWQYRQSGFTRDRQNNILAAVSVLTASINTGYQFYDSITETFNSKAIPQSTGFTENPLIYENLLLLPAPLSNELHIIDLKDTSDNFNDDEYKKITTEDGLASETGYGPISVSVDKNGDAWIGGYNGLRVISNILDYQNAKAEPIIIEQNGIGEELFRSSKILSIATDGANQKWISINEGGVFCLSPNGQRTIHHFTKENSPLPNNDVTDIKINEKTGIVYFVTSDGIVTYKGDITTITKDFGEVLAYPNPVVYANYKGNVKIKGLAEKTNIRITDTVGNLVHQAVARGGYYEWDLTNRGKRVASGIYFVLMTNEDATSKATIKIAVVN